MFHSLARFFRGIHIALGATAIPEDATPLQERKFVLMWMWIIFLSVIWVILIIHWLGVI